MLVFLLLWPQSAKTQVLTPQWTDPFSVPFERLGQGMGKDKKYVRPADLPIIAIVKEIMFVVFYNRLMQGLISKSGMGTGIRL